MLLIIHEQRIMAVRELHEAGFALHKFIDMCRERKCTIVRYDKINGKEGLIGTVLEVDMEPRDGFVYGDIYITDRIIDNNMRQYGMICKIIGWAYTDDAIDLIVDV